MKGDILIIDDETDYLEIAASILEGDGFSVRKAANLDEAWRELKSKEPDILLLDIGLPDGEGTDFAEKIRAEKHLRNLRIIFFSVFADSAHLRSALRNPLNSYVLKPFDPGELLAKVRESLPEK